MADLDLTGWIKDYELQSKPPHLMHTINPSAGWTSDAESYYLIMELPDFKQDEVEFDVDPLGYLIIKGSRLSGNNEHVNFKRRLNLPEDSDMTKSVFGKLQNDMLYITVSRQLVKPNRFEFEPASNEEMREEPESKDAEGKRETKPESKEEKVDDKKGGDDEAKKKEGNAPSQPESKERNVDDEGKKKQDNVPKTILKKLDQHKCIWFGILGFAFGVFVASHKLQQPPRG